MTTVQWVCNEKEVIASPKKTDTMNSTRPLPVTMRVPTGVVAASQRSRPRGNGWMQLQEIEVPQAVSATNNRSSGVLTHSLPSLAHPRLLGSKWLP